MGNKGFTLIELIATIALLGVIVVISFVSVNKVIEQSKVNDCNSLIKSIKMAASEYVSDNRYKRDFVRSVVNNRVEISGSTLTNSNYLSSPIINPFDKEQINPADISIEVVLNNDYTVKQSSIVAPSVLKECKG